MSSDGTKIVGIGGNNVWLSTDSGSTWNNKTAGTALEDAVLSFAGLGASSDLSSIVVFKSTATTNLWISTDTGSSWASATAGTALEGIPAFGSMSMSGDGQSIAVTNGGASWGSIVTGTSAEGTTWTPLAYSSDGSVLALSSYWGGSSGDIWTFTKIVTPAVTSESTPPAPPASSGATNGPIFTGSIANLPGSIAPRPQLIHPGGRVEYISTSTLENLFKTNILPADQSVSVRDDSVIINTTSTVTFARNLEYKMVGNDVKALQVYLNTHGFPVAFSGPGSSGQETQFFGGATYRALIKFQKANSVPGTGYFGPITRGIIK